MKGSLCGGLQQPSASLNLSCRVTESIVQVYLSRNICISFYLDTTWYGLTCLLSSKYGVLTRKKPEELFSRLVTDLNWNQYKFGNQQERQCPLSDLFTRAHNCLQVVRDTSCVLLVRSIRYGYTAFFKHILPNVHLPVAVHASLSHIYAKRVFLYSVNHCLGHCKWHCHIATPSYKNAKLLTCLKKIGIFTVVLLCIFSVFLSNPFHRWTPFSLLFRLLQEHSVQQAHHKVTQCIAWISTQACMSSICLNMSVAACLTTFLMRAMLVPRWTVYIHGHTKAWQAGTCLRRSPALRTGLCLIIRLYHFFLSYGTVRNSVACRQFITAEIFPMQPPTAASL